MRIEEHQRHHNDRIANDLQRIDGFVKYEERHTEIKDRIQVH